MQQVVAMAKLARRGRSTRDVRRPTVELQAARKSAYYAKSTKVSFRQQPDLNTHLQVSRPCHARSLSTRWLVMSAIGRCAPLFRRGAIMLAIMFHVGIALCFADSSNRFEQAFVNFETAPIHPIALSPDHTKLAVCNLADARLEVFDVSSGNLVRVGTVPVGLDPVTVCFKNNQEMWVVNHISDSISVVDLPTMRVIGTIDTLDTPADVVFAGSPTRAYVSCALPNTIQVFDPASRHLVTNVTINAERPKALAVSGDGSKVYAAIFESGNGTTIIGAKFRNLLFFSNVVSRADGPYGGQNPPPNLGTTFSPALNPDLPTNHPPPFTSLVVRKNNAGRWLDDNLHDWTEFVSGTNAH